MFTHWPWWTFDSYIIEEMKRETTMETLSALIVGLWLLPVFICIFVPLILFCVSLVLNLSKRVMKKVKEPASEPSSALLA